MSTRLYFESGRELTVEQSEDDVVMAVRRDYPNPVRIGGAGNGHAVHVNWDHIDFLKESVQQAPGGA
jgi:hypothetical protein